MHLSKKDKVYFNVAKEVSKLSDFPRVHIGACAVYKHKVISTGFNTTKTSPLQKKYNKYRFDENIPGSTHTCHSELSCLKPLIGRKDIDFENVSLYIYREHKNHNLALARPCPSCMALIRDLGIKNIHYTGSGSYVSERLVY